MQVHLKVKIKSLAAESRIIRREERKAKAHARAQLKHQQNCNEAAGVNAEVDLDPLYSPYHSLRMHRVNQVRNEARASLLAYGFMRGRAYGAIEQTQATPGPVLAKALSMAIRFGGKTEAEFDNWLAA